MSAAKENVREDLRGRRVTVYGLGRFGGGVGVIRYLAQQGAVVSVADDANEQVLCESKRELDDVGVTKWLFECSPDDLAGTELLIVNPALRPTHPALLFASEAGVPVSTEIELFCARNQGTVVAVTGSNGKSTTAAMIAHVVSTAGRGCHLGGNFGGSLLDRLSDIQASDVVVLELSSFQLSRLDASVVRPQIAVLTSFAPNHLDWHTSLDDYRKCKQQLFAGLPHESVALLPSDEPEFDDWPCSTARAYFGSDCGEPGVYLCDGSIVFRSDRSEDAIPAWSLRTAGSHNMMNSLAAAAVCRELGIEPTAIGSALPAFPGVPMRLQVVGEFQGRTFVNDSSSTTPESTIEALSAYRRPMVLIAGGADKGVDLSEMASVAAGKAHAAIWIGKTAESLQSTAQRVNPSFTQQCHQSLESAFAAAVDVSKPGDIVILSPGCASFGMYANYKQRGQHFDQLVQRLNQAELSDE